MRGLHLIENVIQDARFAARQLRKHPGFTGTAVLMLALGICASVAIFAFVDAALVKPLPYQRPSELVGVFESVPLFAHSNLSYPDYLDWKRLNTSFSSLDVFEHSGFMLRSADGAEPARGARVSDGFFRTLGVRPILGRDFRTGEDLPSAPRTVLLSHAVWQRRYGSRTNVLGESVTLNGFAYVVIGVLPADFHFAPAEPADFWAALHPESECDLRRSCHSLYGVARLKPGVSLGAASANVEAIAHQLERTYPDSNKGQGASVAPLTDVIVGDVRPILLVLLAGAGLLLFIAGVNVVSLVLVRSENRRREMAMRTALGASRARLIRQFVTESLMLVTAGTVFGLAASVAMMQLLSRLIPADLMAAMPVLQDLGLNPRVLAFAGVIAAAAAVLFALTPAVRGSMRDTREALAEGGRGSGGRVWRRIGSKLVMLELATAMVLLVGAGLLGKSLFLLLQVDLGLRPDHLVTLEMAAPRKTYDTPERRVQLQRTVVERLRSLPGVTSVGFSTDLPTTGWGDTTWFRVLGRPWHGEHNEVPERDVSPDYFHTLGATLVRGRYFTEADDASAPQVAIINRAMAREYFPGEDPLGKQISYLSTPPKPIEIVGIVDDVKEGPIDTPNQSVLYFPFNQSPGTYLGLVVRTSQAETSLLPTMVAALRHIDPDIVTVRGQSMSQRIDSSPAAYIHRSSAWLVGGFAALALLLGAVGLYGVVSYSVSQRTREIGVRMALGAERRSVYHLVLGEAGRLAAVGILAGLVCAVGAARLMSGLLFGVSSWDLPTLLAVALVLAASALLASFIPARRAASIDPIEALRAE